MIGKILPKKKKQNNSQHKIVKQDIYKIKILQKKLKLNKKNSENKKKLNFNKIDILFIIHYIKYKIFYS